LDRAAWQVSRRFGIHSESVTDRRPLDRPATADEMRVILAALEVAATSLESQTLAAELERLHVVSACSCGCASVDFDRAEAERARPVADATGTTERGGTVGVIVWGTAGRVTGLEIYNLGAGADDLRLPIPSTIRPFHAGA